MSQTFIIKAGDSKQVALAIEAIRWLPVETDWEVTIDEELRTDGNNRQQWPILNAIAKQVPWPVDGVMTKISGDEFKQILTAAYRSEKVRIAQGIDGGVVLLGHRTRDFKRSEWQEWIEFLNWFAAEKGVKIPVSRSFLKANGKDYS
jgi:hypothetical protein